MLGTHRRRGHRPGRRRVARTIWMSVALAVAAVFVVGSLAEIGRQSAGYRTMTDSGYRALATPVIDASNRTGAILAEALAGAPHLPVGSVPITARAKLQQSLDEAVQATSDEAREVAGIPPPAPTGVVSDELSAVMEERATAVLGIRSGIDRLLGMSLLPIAGSPSVQAVPGPSPLISATLAASLLGAAGTRIQQADQRYRSLRAQSRIGRRRMGLPVSVWVGSPTSVATLGATQLAALAPALAASPALALSHQLIVTSVGLNPPAVPDGAIGVVGDSCRAPSSLVPGATASMLPPTRTVQAAVTVTNCGNVSESGVVVTESLTLSDPPGVKPPPGGSVGGRSTRTVSLRSGASVGLSMAPLRVAGGHSYSLAISVTVPPGQTDRAGSTQRFLVHITS